MTTDTLRLLTKALTDELESAIMKPARHTEIRPAAIGEWCRREDARIAFGIPPHRLKQLVIERKVRAKKFDMSDPTSIVVFKTSDIRNAIEEMPDYLYDINSTTKGTK